ncbi:hypothetical protein [Mycolicibacterium cosmeticum]|uniref:hypothetical protein n=1 Tax=Mycolicibacterium cosmeticum TaxID=258533 RepID=UPI003204F2DD
MAVVEVSGRTSIESLLSSLDAGASRPLLGQNPAMSEAIRVPTHDALVRELQKVREASLGALRRLRPPALHQAASAAGLTTTDDQNEPAAVEDLIRKAVDRFGGGPYQEAAQYTFGLIGGTKYEPAKERRRQAAATMNVAAETFRKSHEKLIIEQTAEGVLALARDATMRRANVEMQKRHPADSRLAVAWVERFEAYFRIWTPVYALAADLEAALEHYGAEPADHLPWDPDSVEPYDPLHEAWGYARSALYRYAQFLLEIKRFMARHGGMWLFSDPKRETEISDMIYRIGWHNPINEENESWLRRALATSQLEEAQPFYGQLSASTQGDMIHDIWQKFVRDGYEAEITGDTSASQVHSTIAASNEYVSAIDEEWLQIADWYAPGSSKPIGVRAASLYQDHLTALQERRRPPSVPVIARLD